MNNDITTLSDFQVNPQVHIKRLKETGRAQVLTIDGKAEVVLVNADVYQELVDSAELLRALPILRVSLDEANRGEGTPAAEVLAEMRQKLGLQG